MLATLSDPADITSAFDVIEVKYDGFRALAGMSGGSVAVQSRNALDLSARFPVIAKALEGFADADLVFDGELVGEGFHSLQIGSPHVSYAVFDLLWARGEDLRSRPLRERRTVLETILAAPPRHVRLAERLAVGIDRALAIAKQRSLEGVVCKRSDAPYVGGRRKEWRKVKLNTADEFVIVGFVPHSTTPGMIGALLLASRTNAGLRFAGKVGTGFSNIVREQLFAILSARRIASAPLDAPRVKDAVWARPTLLAEIEYTEITADFRLRHPVFRRLREDKAQPYS